MALDDTSDDDLLAELNRRKERKNRGATIPDDAIVMTGKFADKFASFMGFDKNDPPADDAGDPPADDDDGQADKAKGRRFFGDIG